MSCETLNELAAAWVAVLWRASWHGGLILLLLLIVQRAARKISSPARCWLWRLGVIKLLVALIWFFPVELPWLPEASKDTMVRQARIESVSRPASPTPNAAIAGLGSDNATVDQRPKERASLSVYSLLLLAWTLGVVWSALRLGRQWIDVRRCIRSARPVVCARKQRLFSQSCRELGLSRSPDLLVSHVTPLPVLAGVFKAVILFPSGVMERCSDDEFRAALLHELAHLKRRELGWNLLLAAAGVIFFFHPLLWLAKREWRTTQEIATDELAVTSSRLATARYAKSLLGLLEKCPPPAAIGPDLVVSVSDSYKQLVRRMVAMQSFGKSSRRRRYVEAATVCLTGLALIVPWKLTAAPPASNATIVSTDPSSTKGVPQDKRPPQKKTKNKRPKTDAARARERRLKKIEPRFRKIYRLDKGQVLRHIPEPLNRELRTEWYTAMFGGLSSDRMEIVTLYVQWKGNRPRWKGATVGFRGGGVPIKSVLMMLNVASPEFVDGDSDLIDRKIPGDWVFDPKAKAEQVVAAMQAALRKEWGLPVQLGFREVEREVYVVRGKWKFQPIGGAEKSVHIYGNFFDPDVTRSRGSGTFQKFLEKVGRWIDRPVINEVTQPPKKRLSWRRHMPSPFTQQQWNDAHNAADVTDNLAAQTGLKFMKRRRKVRVLFITHAKSEAP